MSGEELRSRIVQDSSGVFRFDEEYDLSTETVHSLIICICMYASNIY